MYSSFTTAELPALGDSGRRQERGKYGDPRMICMDRGEGSRQKRSKQARLRNLRRGQPEAKRPDRLDDRQGGVDNRKHGRALGRMPEPSQLWKTPQG